jgi:UDP:flavonoid glycosyltransferase YjiC (YdhE family)
MRALFTCTPLYGHFLPLIPIARAMADAGHDVAFGTPGSFREPVETAGFRWVRAGVEDDDPELIAVLAQHRELQGVEQTRFGLREIMGGIRPRRLVPDLLALAETWRPDLIVRESREFGALIAAELLDVPYAQVQVNAAGAMPHLAAMLYEPLRHLRVTFGLPDRSIQDLMDRYLVLTPFPISLNRLGDPIAATAHHIRALPQDGADSALPAWCDEIGSRRLIYVSMGTVFSGWRGREIFSKLLAGLRDIDAEIVVTVGHDLNIVALGPQPEHIHLETFLPLGTLLPRCSLVLFHGGSGTLSHVVAHGLPAVIIPLGADQPENAVHYAELGASRTLDQDQLTPEHVREVALDVLNTSSYRQSAERLRDEFNALPGPELAVTLLERLARDKAPIIA